MARSGALIQVSQKGEGGGNGAERTVTMMGSAEAVAAAQHFVKERLKEIEAPGPKPKPKPKPTPKPKPKPKPTPTPSRPPACTLPACSLLTSYAYDARATRAHSPAP